ncbi:MAG: GntR family transcriptional regulator [Chloroflexota bacterium]|nr:GntR family transcriptional regulator [Chloroflexota bacterium]
MNAPDTSSLPLYAQLKAVFVEAITSGQLESGSRLPSHRDLSAQHKVSYMTVRRAIDELVREGYVHSVPGRGTYVTVAPKQQAESGPFVSFTQDMAGRGMRASSQVLSAAIVGANTSLAYIMDVPIGAQLWMLVRLRLADDAPMALQTACLPSARFPNLLDHDFSSGSLYAILRERYGVQFDSSTSAVEAALAGADEAALLGVTPPVALLITEQITKDEQGSIFEYVRSAYRADLYKMSLHQESGTR